jgi:tRNA nucleotidyltransferase (CCA-adding enzyme)
MKIYTVGGAVRDQLLGLAIKDRDHVVVGATPQEMIDLGYRPVGRDFPVFLHPQTQEEYALARTERKSAPGYHGFVIHAAPDVSLADDLVRRDLTINAMARDELTGELIDPCQGEQDLRAGILRHVGPAFVEDPVRLLRVARFAARFDFTVAADTKRLLCQMVDQGEVDHLVPERVWQEFSRGLMEPRPERMLAVLTDCDALTRLLPDCPQAGSTQAVAALTRAAARGASLAERYSAWLGGVADDAGATRLSRHLRVPVDCRDLLALSVRLRARVVSSATADAATLSTLLREADAYRRPQRLQALCAVCADLAGVSLAAAPWAARLSHALSASEGVNTALIATQHPEAIAPAIEQARTLAIERALSQAQATTREPPA